MESMQVENSFCCAKILNNSFKDHIQEKNCESLSSRLHPADHHRVSLALLSSLCCQFDCFRVYLLRGEIS